MINLSYSRGGVDTFCFYFFYYLLADSANPRYHYKFGYHICECFKTLNFKNGLEHRVLLNDGWSQYGPAPDCIKDR